MNHTEHSAKSPSTWTGRLATLGRLFGVKGSGAPSFALVALLLVLALVLASSASGRQTRLYTGVSFGPEGTAGTATVEDVRSVAVGHTTGGALAFDYAAVATDEDKPAPRAVFAVYPGRNRPSGKVYKCLHNQPTFGC